MDKAELDAIKTRVGDAHKMVSALCKPRGSAGAREWLMSIPARPDYDPDIVIDRSLRDIHALLAEVEELLAVKKSHEQQLENLARENDMLRDTNRHLGGGW